MRLRSCKRIVEAGGMVIIQRVNGSLAVSRALGDFEYKADANRLPQNQLVSPEADVFVSERDFGRDQHLVLACDGIWDVMSNDDVCQFVSNKIKQGREVSHICADLLDSCLSRGSKDNMSVIIVSFPQTAGSSSSHPVQLSSSRSEHKQREELVNDDISPSPVGSPTDPSGVSPQPLDNVPVVNADDISCMSPIWTSFSSQSGDDLVETASPLSPTSNCPTKGNTMTSDRGDVHIIGSNPEDDAASKHLCSTNGSAENDQSTSSPRTPASTNSEPSITAPDYSALD